MSKKIEILINICLQTDLLPTSSAVRFYTDCLSSTEILAAHDFYNQSIMNDGSIDENFIDFNQLPTAPEYIIDPTTEFDFIDPRISVEPKSKRKVSIHQSFDDNIEVDNTSNNNNTLDKSNHDTYPGKSDWKRKYPT
jgi:hypothetical protein